MQMDDSCLSTTMAAQLCGRELYPASYQIRPRPGSSKSIIFSHCLCLHHLRGCWTASFFMLCLSQIEIWNRIPVLICLYRVLIMRIWQPSGHVQLIFNNCAQNEVWWWDYSRYRLCLFSRIIEIYESLLQWLYVDKVELCFFPPSVLIPKRIPWEELISLYYNLYINIYHLHNSSR